MLPLIKSKDCGAGIPKTRHDINVLDDVIVRPKYTLLVFVDYSHSPNSKIGIFT